jgi:hypothetical protein
MSNDESSRKDREIPEEDIIDYLAGDIDDEKRRRIEEQASIDPELAAEIEILRALTRAAMEGDTGTIANFADALGIPLDDFIPDEYEVVAGATFHLLKGAVSHDEARAYAAYRKEADQLGAHEVQRDYLDRRALQAVVEAGIFPDIQQAEAAVWKVVNALLPVLNKKGDSQGNETPPKS